MITLANTPEQELKGLIERARARIRTHFSHDVVAKKLGSMYQAEIGHCCRKDKRLTSGA
jgi:hypothetical protein